MSSTIIPVILSGGSGTRLWPLSRKQYPKQFLPLTGNNTMLQETVSRLDPIEDIGTPIIVCNEEHRFLVAEQLQGRDRTIILEPEAKNTAPAITLAAIHALTLAENPILLILPADHDIKNTNAFHSAINHAKKLANDNYLVTFGILPTSPKTGYGYIEVGKRLSEKDTYLINKFVEKPNQETAIEYIESGQYYWNSGMFVFQANTFLKELEKYQSDIYSSCKSSIEKAQKDLDFIRIDKTSFSSSPSISIDYAVMEKTQNASIVTLDAGWNDVGSWRSLWETNTKDDDGNVVVGEILTTQTKDSLLYSSGRLIATVGIKDLIVVETSDAIMVAHKNESQKVKDIVEKLRKKDCFRTVAHRKVTRPWGSYDSVDQGDRFQVKRIVVNPGSTLSLQMHHHRAEHWVIVKGTAKVTKGDKVFLLEENQSTYIPLGVKHRLENPGSIPLEIIEIQSGSYLGEDDIVRFEDVYGRSNES